MRTGRLIGAVALVGSVLAAAVSSGPATARTRLTVLRKVETVNVVKILGARVGAVRRNDGGIPVLLPTTLQLTTPKGTESAATHNGYRLELDYAEPCDGANACTAAQFTAQRGKTKPYGTAVTLSDGIKGAYAGIQCGASCSPASIEWREHGVLYSIIATLGVEVQAQPGPGVVTRAFVAAADQAIGAGPR
jgi:hypothetical protein